MILKEFFRFAEKLCYARGKRCERSRNFLLSEKFLKESVALQLILRAVTLYGGIWEKKPTQLG